MLRNVVAIVSGGSSGLGAATATHIVRRGGRVVIADLPSAHDNFLRLATNACAEVHIVSGGELAEGVSCDLYYPHGIRNGKVEKSSSNIGNGTGRESGTRSKSREGPILAFAETDVRDEEQVKSALDLAEKTFGEPVNVSVSCAGICPAQKTISKKPSKNGTNFTDSSGEPEIRTHSLASFSETLQVNTIGTFNLARLSAERMAMRDPDAEGMRGCIINTASIAAFEGQTGQVAYAASKGAVVGMTLPLARDLASHGIRVMTVAPGLFKTPLLDGLPTSVQQELGKMVPCPSRLGNPDEFAKLVVSILGNPMLNGEVIRLDGALRMPP